MVMNYTQDGQKNLAQIVKQARGENSYEEFASKIGIVTRFEIVCIEERQIIDIGRPIIGIIGAIATQTLYSAPELLAILEAREVKKDLPQITGEQYFQMGTSQLSKPELGKAVERLVAFLIRGKVDLADSVGIGIRHKQSISRGEYTESGLKALAQVVLSSRGSISYDKFARMIGNISHMTIKRIEKCEVKNPSFGIIGAIATQTPYTWQELVAMAEERLIYRPDLDVLTSDQYFNIGVQQVPRNELVATVSRLIAFF